MNAGALAAAVALATLGTTLAQAQQGFSSVQIETEKVARGIYVLKGSGGNIGLCVGKDGAFLVDDQFAPLSRKILAAVKSLTPEPPRFLVNTHWHGDHTGGNESMGEAGAHHQWPTRTSAGG
jgi:cyclase